MRRTCVLQAAEFKQKSRWSAVWPNMHYGAMFLPYGPGRQLPMRGVNWVTRDSNRLTNYSNRYSSVIADIDAKRTEEELQIPLADIRWNDHRRIYWKCSFCGSAYRKSVSVRTKFHAGCNFCKGKHSSNILGEGKTNTPISKANPELVAQLTGEEVNKANLAGLSCTSQFRAEWICAGCKKPYRTSIRSRTGVVEQGQSPLHPHSAEWNGYCIGCRWNKNLKPLGEQIIAKGQYLGLEESMQSASKNSNNSASANIPRRKRFVC